MTQKEEFKTDEPEITEVNQAQKLKCPVLINLPTENFDAGLYFLVVYKENSVLAKEKLIVQ